MMEDEMNRPHTRILRTLRQLIERLSPRAMDEIMVSQRKKVEELVTHILEVRPEEPFIKDPPVAEDYLEAWIDLWKSKHLHAKAG